MEICHDQTWGMVSGLGWGEEDARVTCNQLQLSVDGNYNIELYGKFNTAAFIIYRFPILF